MPTVKINVLEAQNLFGADLDGNSDPYCIVKIGEGNQFSCLERTRTIKNTKNPTWKEVFTLNVNNPLTESLFVEVMNKERSKDNSLGYAQMSLHDLTRGIEKQVWLQLEGGAQSTGVIGTIASHLGGKKKEKVNQGKVFLGVTALDFGLDTSTYPPGQGGMMHGVPLGQVQQQHLPGMQPGLQPGMQQPGMQQPGMQQQGIQSGLQPGMQQPGMQQGGIQQHSGLPGTQQYPGTGSTISHEGMSQPPPQHFVGSNQPGIQSGMAPGMQSGMQQPLYTEHGLQQPSTGVQPGAQQYPGGIQQQTGMQQQGIQHPQPGMQYPPSSGSSHHDQPKSAYPENL